MSFESRLDAFSTLSTFNMKLVNGAHHFNMGTVSFWVVLVQFVEVHESPKLIDSSFDAHYTIHPQRKYHIPFRGSWEDDFPLP